MPPFANMTIEEMRRSCRAVCLEAQALQSRARASAQRVSETRDALVEIIEIARHTREELRAVRDLGRSPPVLQHQPATPDALCRALAAAGLDEDDLEELTDDLIAAYREAGATGNDEMEALLGRALRQIGYHIATRLGPKAAGTRLS